MKKIVFVLVLGLGLMTLSACSLFDQNQVGQESVSESSAEDQATIVDVDVALIDGNYQINSSDSRVVWEASKVIATHTGTVAAQSGVVQIAEGMMVGGSLVMDIASLTSDENISFLVTHLKSADFFDVAVYPTAELVITLIQPGDAEGEYNAQGDLTIKGITQSIDFPVRAVMVGEQLEVRSQLNIDRTRWGIKYGSGQFFQDLGNSMIDDNIIFDVIIKADRSA